MADAVLFHITTREAWEAAVLSREYRPASLETDGFVHCSTASQVCDVARRYYPDTPDLVLLCLATDLLTAPVAYEESEPGQWCPHVYGPIRSAAVLAAVELPLGSDGEYSLPDEAARLAGVNG